TRSTAFDAVSRDFVIASEISRTEALSCSAPAATDSIMPRTASLFIRAITCAVTSEAYFTTLKGLPLRSRIGLYDAWIQTLRPPLPTRAYSADWNSPRLRLAQNSR